MKSAASLNTIHTAAFTSYLECMALRALDVMKEKTQIRKVILALEQLGKDNSIPWKGMYPPLIALCESGKNGKLPGLK